jgi:hypothetical protein
VLQGSQIGQAVSQLMGAAFSKGTEQLSQLAKNDLGGINATCGHAASSRRDARPGKRVEEAATRADRARPG